MPLIDADEVGAVNHAPKFVGVRSEYGNSFALIIGSVRYNGITVFSHAHQFKRQIMPSYPAVQEGQSFVKSPVGRQQTPAVFSNDLPEPFCFFSVLVIFVNDGYSEAGINENFFFHVPSDFRVYFLRFDC